MIDDTMVSVGDSKDISIRATSPVIGVNSSAFYTPGEYHYPYSNAYGYYRDTNEWPVGSGNYLTNLIKWTFIGNVPVVNGTPGVVGLSIDTEGTYLYNVTNDTIQLFDSNSYLRLEDVEVQFGLLSKNSDIITKITKNISCNGSQVSVNWRSWVGLLPYGMVYRNEISSFK